jgi:putative heme-binding domain-containing protein
MAYFVAPVAGLARILAVVAALAPSFALADAAGDIKLPPGYHAELVYSVPLPMQGSWVSLAVDAKGRIIASDQNGALYRVEPSALGADAGETKVESIPMNVGMAQGLLAIDDKLYVMMNGRLGAFSSGLYRLTDGNKDDRYDKLEQLRVFQGDGEHGPHAVVPSPDGKHLYFICGNFTELPLFARSFVPPRWGEDQMLPRLNDPNGHANNIVAPGGWVARTDLDGKNLELVSVGYRNAYDIAFNADGELFTFDSDMEWDIGAPWYRATRVCHVVSGSDYGWRAGNAPWPQYYPDTLPTVVDVGPGSPTGIAFGTGTKFPKRYQRALFVGDWSYGHIFAVHLTPSGASYRGEVERFASAMPLAVTDMVVRPQDGALYFAVGGRQSESALYRIVADASDAGTDAAADGAAEGDGAAAEARELRHSLEVLHAGAEDGAVEKAWPQMSNADRFVRYAARVAVEHQPIDQWSERAINEPNTQARITGLLALARTGASESALRWSESLAGIAFEKAGRDRRLDLLRTASLGVMRFNPLPETVRQNLLQAYDSHFPTGDYLADRELGNLLIRLKAPNLVPRLMTILDRAATQEEGIDAAIALSAAEGPWTFEERTHLLDWFDRMGTSRGGRSYFGYIVGARDRFIQAFPAEDRVKLAERLAKPLVETTAAATVEPRPFVREWGLDEATALVEADKGPRDLQNGRKMFSAATCYNCHRVAGEGSSVGPDLTGVGRRFGVRDILRSIIEPNHVVSDQYRQMVFETNGRTIVGRITNLSESAVMVSTDMLDPKKEVSIRRDEIDDQHPSDVSLMPTGLLNSLSESEVLDLIAFLRAGGVE